MYRFIKHLIKFYGNSYERYYIIYIFFFFILISKLVPIIYYFYAFSFQNNTVLENIVNNKSSIDDKINYGPDKRIQAIKLLMRVLDRGLTNRVNRLCILPNKSKNWECIDEIPDNIGEVTIGIELNPDTCFSIVDKGPEANLPEVSNICNNFI